MERGAALATVAAVVIIFETVATQPARAARPERVIHVTARKFEYSPSEITVKRGVPVILELTSLDRHHGFNLKAFNIRADINPGEVTRVRLLPQQTGHFPFACDVFCGDGHDDMSGELVVVE